LDDWRQVLATAKQQPGVVAAAPEVISQAGISAGHDYGEGVNLLGFDPDTGTRAVTSFPQSIKKGDLSFQPKRKDVDGAILLGSRLANRLTVWTGDVVTLVPVTQAKLNPALGVAVPKFWKFEVTGLFETGMFQYDNQFVVVSRSVAQQFTGWATRCRASPFACPIRRLRPKWAGSWKSVWATPIGPSIGRPQNASLFSALELEKLAMGLIIFFIMVVAAFNIVGTLTMVVADKTREIGILQAMGLTAPAVARIFLAQGAIIGLVGTTLGLLGGLAVSYVVDRSVGSASIPRSISSTTPVHVELLDVSVVVLASVGIALLATLYPSRSAARLTPVEAIRHE
jgi:lipoprotein-releasing system permease protein